MTDESKPLVSAIISVYRAKKYLAGFLEWLPQQTYFDRLEVVIDHNEPSAEERAMMMEFMDRYPGRIQYLVRDKVVPYSVSWNRCLHASKGDYLTVWNIDDLRTPDSIESQARYLQDHPEIDIVFGQFIQVPKFQTTQGILIDRTDLHPEELTMAFYFGPFFMFRRALLEKAGYVDEQFRSSADFDFGVRLALNGRAHGLNQVLGYYLNEELGLSTNPNSPLPYENTAIRMRYGIYDRIFYNFIFGSLKYDRKYIHYGQDLVPVGRYVPGYDQLMKKRYRKLLPRGVLSYLGKLVDRDYVNLMIRRL